MTRYYSNSVRRKDTLLSKAHGITMNQKGKINVRRKVSKKETL